MHGEHQAVKYQFGSFVENSTLGRLLHIRLRSPEIPDAMNAMHTAFDNPGAGPNAIPWESIEARFFAFFERPASFLEWLLASTGRPLGEP